VNHSASESGPQLGFVFEAPKAETRRIWKVAELVGEVRTHIEREYADLWVEGEISNLRPAPSGHIYFTLKDGDAQLPAVLFRRQASLLRFRPEDGLQVLVRGKVSVYEQRGQMQIVAEFMEPVGAGSLQVAFEQLKAQLQQEGLFDQARKKPLPAFPRCVGIITSPTGAVIRDFLNVAGRRHAALDVLLYPASVQGETAAAEIASGVVFFNRARSVDLIVIARGGGSLEDLAPFNSELLARAIAASELPVVSAVGHETDFTIADFVADLRAPTPSAAAEIITGALHRIEEQVESLALRLSRACRYRLMQARDSFARLSVDASFARLRESFGRRQQRVDELRFRMEAAWSSANRDAWEQLHRLTARLLRQDATHRLQLLRERVTILQMRLVRSQQNQIREYAVHLQGTTRQLNTLSPLAVLNRGYALVFNESGTLVKDASKLTSGQMLITRLAEGSVESRITEIRPGRTP
jgi:exodeoxyribonuclease VII large subunit